MLAESVLEVGQIESCWGYATFQRVAYLLLKLNDGSDWENYGRAKTSSAGLIC